RLGKDLVHFGGIGSNLSQGGQRPRREIGISTIGGVENVRSFRPDSRQHPHNIHSLVQVFRLIVKGDEVHAHFRFQAAVLHVLERLFEKRLRRSEEHTSELQSLAYL